MKLRWRALETEEDDELGGTLQTAAPGCWLSDTSWKIGTAVNIQKQESKVSLSILLRLLTWKQKCYLHKLQLWDILSAFSQPPQICPWYIRLSFLFHNWFHNGNPFILIKSSNTLTLCSPQHRDYDPIKAECSKSSCRGSLMGLHGKCHDTRVSFWWGRVGRFIVFSNLS